MDYEEEYEQQSRFFDDLRSTNNRRYHHLLDFYNQFGPWWDWWDYSSRDNDRYHLRDDKYKSRRKGRC